MSFPMAPQPVADAVKGASDENTQLMTRLLQQVFRQQSHLPSTPGGVPAPTAQAKKDDTIIPGQGRQAFQQEMGQKVANDIMSGVQQAVQQHKQKQINEATAMWQTLQAAHERLMMTNQAKPDGTVDLMQDPMAAAILQDPKKMKQMAKAFNVDFLNPEKTNVYAEGLKKAMKLDKAGKMVKVLRSLKMAHQPQPQLDPAQQQQMGGEMGKKVEGMTAPQGPDPKVLEGMAKVMEMRATHEENMELRKQMHEDSINMQRQSLELRRTQVEGQLADQKLRIAEMAQYHRELLDIRRQEMELRAQQAENQDDVGAMKRAVQSGFPISQYSPKDRAKITSQIDKEGGQVPTPISPKEQEALSDGLNQIFKIRTWQSTLESTAKGPDGKLSNKPFGSFYNRMKYKVGFDTPEAAIISDFSRERWAAIGGLVRGVRRGDILQDMIQHTPDPWKDSAAIMDTKLKALEANYSLARASVLKQHGLTYDPVTGNDLDTDIKSYEDHLKVAKDDIKNERAKEQIK